MSFYLFVQTTALITWSLYLSIFFACALFFGLFQAIGRHFQPANDQTDTHCCITANAWAFNRPDLQNYSSVFLHAFLSHCVSQWLPSLAPTHAIPLYFILRESIFCQTQVPANKMWMPVINERAQRSGSRNCSTVSALDGSRPPFLGPFPLPPGIYSCAWSKSLQAGVCCHASILHMHMAASLCLLCFKVLQNPFRFPSPCLFKYAWRWQFLCPIRKLI